VIVFWALMLRMDPDEVHFSYRRYLINPLRKRFGFEGAPVRVWHRPRRRDDKLRGAQQLAGTVTLTVLS
jgi:predicted GTPase